MRRNSDQTTQTTSWPPGGEGVRAEQRDAVDDELDKYLVIILLAGTYSSSYADYESYTTNYIYRERECTRIQYAYYSYSSTTLITMHS